jgi:acetyl-CoA acetyltransferase
MGSLNRVAAIVGIGETTYSKNSGMTEATLHMTAVKKCLEDSGLKASDIDAVMPQTGSSIAEDYINNLGMTDCKYTTTVHMGGASTVTAVQSAVMAVEAGVANYVLVVQGRNGSSGGRVSSGTVANAGGPMRQMAEFEQPYGSYVPMQWYAPMARRHMHEYGTTSQQFGAIAVATRKHAMMNGNAMMTKPITLEDHQNSRMMADPFRLLDCCLQTDGAAAIIVTSLERARDLKTKPAVILGVAEGHPDTPTSITQRPSMTKLGLAKAAPRAWAMAGVKPEDCDGAEIYDCFTYTVLCQLEDAGFCKKGEGGAFVEGGRIEIGGEFPVNTHGGLLSQGHIQGMNHIVEGVKQIRGSSPVQIKDAKLIAVSGYGDFGDGALMILGEK